MEQMPYPRYGSDLPVPRTTIQKFLYKGPKDRNRILNKIFDQLSIRCSKKWPVNIKRSEFEVEVWIAGRKAFSYEGCHLNLKNYLLRLSRDGDFALLEIGPHREHPWSFLWYCMPIKEIDTTCKLPPIPRKDRQPGINCETRGLSIQRTLSNGLYVNDHLIYTEKGLRLIWTTSDSS